MESELKGRHQATPDEDALAAAFRERLISLGSMDRPMRLAVAGAVASLVAAAAFLIFSRAGHPTVFLDDAPVPHGIAQAYLIVVLVLLSVGMGYLVTAAALTSPKAAVPLLVLLLGALGYWTGAFGSMPGAVNYLSIFPTWGAFAARGLLLLLAVVAAATLLGHRGNPPRHAMRRSHLVVLLVNIALFGAYWLTIARAAPTYNGTYYLGPLVWTLLTSVSFMLFPLLYVAAVDFGEWGQLAGQRLSTVTRGTDRRQYVVAGAACLALLVYAYVNAGRAPLVSWERVGLVARGTLVVGAVCGLSYLAGRLLRLRGVAWPRGLGFGPLIAVAAVSLIVTFGSGLIGRAVAAPPKAPDQGFARNDAERGWSGGTGNARLTMLVPRSWRITTDAHGISGFAFSRTSTDTVVANSAAGEATWAQLVGALPDQDVGPVQSIGLWQTGSTTERSTGATGAVWLRNTSVNGQPVIYLVSFRHTGADIGAAQRTWAAMVGSVRTAAQEAALPPGAVADADSEREIDRDFTLDLALSLALVVALLGAVAAWPRLPRRAVLAVLLLGMVTLVHLLTLLPTAGRVLFGRDVSWLVISRYSVLTGVALVGSAALAWTFAHGRTSRRLATQLLGLVGGVVAIDVVYRLYSGAISASHVSIWAAAILLVAVSWELLMSGESVTNLSSQLFPRSARVLAMFGYTTLLSGMVLFFSAQTEIGTGAPTEAWFEPEKQTRAALYLLALPVFVLVFFLQLTRVAPDPVVAAQPPEPPVEPAPPEAPTASDRQVPS